MRGSVREWPPLLVTSEELSEVPVDRSRGSPINELTTKPGLEFILAPLSITLGNPANGQFHGAINSERIGDAVMRMHTCNYVAIYMYIIMQR
jgi:hypothetical protein